MTEAPISLQDLRQRIYDTAKADTTKRFWGLYVHVAKLETLRAGYDLAKRNNGAPGIDGVTFEAIEAAGLDAWLAQLRDELVTRTYWPLRNRRVEIPKDGGTKVRVLGIPACRKSISGLWYRRSSTSGSSLGMATRMPAPTRLLPAFSPTG